MDPATERIAALCADLTNYERDRPDRPRFGLNSMRRLLARAGAPALPRSLIQVGGSKGKGTTARYLAALSGASRTGIFLSPHVETVLERVVIDGQNVDEELLTAQLRPVLAAAKRGGIAVSFYEAMTAAALGCFAEAGVELGVLEVGLGGRLDATTAVPVDAAVLTSVELEHTDILGDTLEAIAAEKAPILRVGKPAVIGVEGAGLRVVVEHAQAVSARLAVLGEEFGFEHERRGSDSVVALWASDGARAEITIVDAPGYEVRAAALAWQCLRMLDPDFAPPRRIARPAAPGCFELFEPGPIVVDGAHTAESSRLLADELARRFGDERFDLLFAIASGKRWQRCLEPLLGRVGRAHVTELEGTRSESADGIASWLTDRGVDARAVPSAAEGLAALRAAGGLGVVAGSFYLAGAVRPSLRQET